MRLFRKPPPVQIEDLVAAKIKEKSAWSAYCEISAIDLDGSIPQLVQQQIACATASHAFSQAELEYDRLWSQYKKENKL